MDYNLRDHFDDANWISRRNLDAAYKDWVTLFDQAGKFNKHLGHYREVLLSIYKPFLTWIKLNKRSQEEFLKKANTRWFVNVHPPRTGMPLMLNDLLCPRSDKFNPPIQYFQISAGDVELFEQLSRTDDDPTPDEDKVFKSHLSYRIASGESSYSDILQLSEEPSRMPLNGWNDINAKIVITLPKMSFTNKSVVLTPPLLLAVIDWSASEDSLLASIKKLKSLAYFSKNPGRPLGFTPKISDFECLLIGQINADRKPKDKIKIANEEKKSSSTSRMRFDNIKKFLDPIEAEAKSARPSSPKSRIGSMQKRYVK